MTCRQSGPSKKHHDFDKEVAISKFGEPAPPSEEFTTDPLFDLASGNAYFEWPGIGPTWSSQGICEKSSKDFFRNWLIRERASASPTREELREVIFAHASSLA